MAQNDKLKDKLITYLQDAAAMEHEITEVLQKQVGDTKQWPEIQQRIQQHLDATKTHHQRMVDRLKSYNEKPSGVKSAFAAMMGNMVGMTAGAKTDALAKEARDDYATEHLEIAAYELLIATASAYGDNATVQACELNLRDEVEMAQWLERNLPRTAILSYQQDGILVSQTEATTAERTALDAVQRSRSAIGGLYQQAQPGEMPAQPTM